MQPNLQVDIGFKFEQIIIIIINLLERFAVLGQFQFGGKQKLKSYRVNSESRCTLTPPNQSYHPPTKGKREELQVIFRVP